IIGVGGIFSGDDAFEMIKAGSSAVQLYTSLVFEGPSIIKNIKRRLSHLLRLGGFRSVKEAVGIDNYR
ncbi:MAG: dihydroorotate dehydrogenase (quinone), partial [Candidatus Dadabacteria bacterium]